jgi:hypothetical protein
MLKAGDEVDAWCTKCRMDLLHRILAVVAGAPKRVECQTCHSPHNYRAPKGATASAARGAPAAGKTKKKTAAPGGARAAKAVHEWESYISGKNAGAFRPYSIAARFEPAQLIQHKKFGEGYVLEVLADNKINVIFREGYKLLVHGR